ncbi:MAG: hypothetical protein E6G44_07645 [Actinobacteria bacterium]|nr:MAG: hypothetical protein E6G44_07645 [Actinomycetota bacterium]
MKQWELRGITVTADRQADGPVDAMDPLRILVNQLPALFWTTDPDLVLTSSLGAELDRLGLGPNQLVGARLAELFEMPEDAELIDAHREALAGGSVRFQARWGGRAIRARVAPLRDSGGQVIGTICVALEDEVDTPVTARSPRRAVAGAAR